MGLTPFHKETDWRFGRSPPERVFYNFIVVEAFSNVKGEYGGKCLFLNFFNLLFTLRGQKILGKSERERGKNVF